MDLPHQTPAMNDPDSPLGIILDELGFHTLLKLRTHLGGMDIKVPTLEKTLTDDHWLVVAVGHDDAASLCNLVGGSSFYIPQLELTRIDDVMRESATGKRNSEVARSLKISTRHVRRLKRHAAMRSARETCASPA